MNTEEPQNESTVIEQVASQHDKLTKGQNQQIDTFSDDHDSADSDEENVVLFDTTHSQSSQPDILKTYASVGLW